MGRNLSCKKDFMRAFMREETPKRLHYTNNKRIGDLVVDLDPGYLVKRAYSNRNYPHLTGQHGYDYLFHLMDVSRDCYY